MSIKNKSKPTHPPQIIGIEFSSLGASSRYTHNGQGFNSNYDKEVSNKICEVWPKDLFNYIFKDFEDFINSLDYIRQELVKQGYYGLKIYFDKEEYSDEIDLSISALRLETDDELNVRLEQENKQKEKQKQREKAEKESKHQRDYKEYLRLKKKFEK